jgi:outer membrane receptor protein involved in Fe transport
VTWGFELEGEWRFLPQWQLRSEMSSTVGDITSREAIQQIYGLNSDRVPLESVPPYRGHTALRWNTTSGRFWVEGAGRWSWRTNRLPPPIPGVGQFSTFKSEWLVGDVMAGARLPGGQRLLLGVRNVTDTPYRQALGSLEEPGINLVGSLSADF